MKYLLTICLLINGMDFARAQQPSVAQLQQKARILMQQGDNENAIQLLTRASALEPKNLEVLKDLSYVFYLERDFAKAIETGMAMVGLKDADPQAYQILGLSYKAIASYKDCEKLYSEGLKKFPNSGVLYNENGELLIMLNKPDDALLNWERGIELSPGYSSNYYNAAIYYVRTKNWIRAALYGEIFLNLESYSKRAGEVKPQLWEVFTKLFNPIEKSRLLQLKETSAFEKTLLELLDIPAGKVSVVNSVDQVISIRTRFLVAWLQGHQLKYPFALFDRLQYLLNQGLFEAYHYWLFEPESYSDWKKKHPKESEGYTAFQQSRVFKLTKNEYYFKP